MERQKVPWGNGYGLLPLEKDGFHLTSLWFRFGQNYEIEGNVIRLYIDTNSCKAHWLFQLILWVLLMVFLLVRFEDLSVKLAAVVAVFVALGVTIGWLNTIRSSKTIVSCSVILMFEAAFYFSGESSAYLFIFVSALLLVTWIKTIRRNRITFTRDIKTNAVTAEIVSKGVFCERAVSYSECVRIFTSDPFDRNYCCPISVQPEQQRIIIKHTGPVKFLHGGDDIDVNCGIIFPPGKSLESFVISVNTLCPKRPSIPGAPTSATKHYSQRASPMHPLSPSAAYASIVNVEIAELP